MLSRSSIGLHTELRGVMNEGFLIEKIWYLIVKEIKSWVFWKMEDIISEKKNKHIDLGC